MCCVCTRLELSENDEDWTPAHAHDDDEEEDEEEVEMPQPHRPRAQMASRSPREETVVEPAPSHDNTPAFAAYSVLEGTESAERMKQRAPYGLCIYDVTVDASPSRAEQMACSIFERTMAYRRGPDGEADRVEVVVLPLREVQERSVATERELVEHCMRHFEKERTSRLVMENTAMARSWYLPELLYNGWYNMGIRVISRVTDRWEEGLDWVDGHPEERCSFMTEAKAYNSQFGTFLLVRWQPREFLWRAYDEPFTPESRTHVSAYSLEELRAAAKTLYGPGARTFHEHFLSDGILDLELAAARDKGS